MKNSFSTNVLNMRMCCCSLVRGPAIWGEVTVYWRIVPPSVGEFAETSGKLTMREGQSAAIVVIQVLMSLVSDGGVQPLASGPHEAQDGYQCSPTQNCKFT